MLKYTNQPIQLRVGGDDDNDGPWKASGRVHHIPIAMPEGVEAMRIPRAQLKPRVKASNSAASSASSLSPASSNSDLSRPSHKENSVAGGRPAPKSTGGKPSILSRRPGGSTGILKTRSSVKMGGHSNPTPTLPISMEDTELFPRHKFGINDHPSLAPSTLAEMKAGLNGVWWSRLVTATRGYVVNAFRGDEDVLFLFDDAFIALHAALVEGGAEEAGRLLRDLGLLEADGCEALQALESGLALDEADNPFHSPSSRNAYRRLFGAPPAAYARAFKMGFAFLVFFNVLARVGARWEARKGKKAIRFSEDPEWHPDARVVLFEELGNGARAWVLSDYDRHLIAYWRPKGVHVIFGDRYIQAKKEEGFRLCAHCGLLESFPGQFRPGPRRPHADPHFCSDDCLGLYAKQP